MNLLEMTTFLRGGAGVLTTKLACYFNEQGHNVTVVSSGEIEGLTDWKELVADLQSKGVDYKIINTFKRESDLLWQSVDLVARIIQEKNIDIIHVHAGVPAFIVQMAQKLLNIRIPTIATFHSWSVDRPTWMNTADTTVFNMCDMIIYDSEEYLSIGRSVGVKPIDKVIYPYTNNIVKKREKKELRESLNKEYQIPLNAVILSNLAEVTERKGQLDLIEPLYLLRKQGIDAYIIIIGECKNKEYLNAIKNKVRKLGLEKYFIIMGWMEHPEYYVQASDLFVFPSYSEGLGMAIVETLRQGVPAIFSNCEGMKDIEKILGFASFGVFEPGNISSIEQAIKKVLNINTQMRSEKLFLCQEKLKEYFDFNVMTREYYSIMNEHYKRGASAK